MLKITANISTTNRSSYGLDDKGGQTKYANITHMWLCGQTMYVDFSTMDHTTRVV